MGKKSDRQDKYVEARVNGVPAKQALVMAGYSETTQPSDLEKVGTEVSNKILKALASKGINEDYLATEYASGIEASGKDGARDKDLNAKAQFLKQLGYLMGYGKSNPTVAVQINNHTGKDSELEPGRAAELLSEVTTLLKVFKEDFGLSESVGVHAGSSGVADSESRTGVGESSPEASEVSRRGIKRSR